MNASAINKMRWKFIFTAMISFFVVVVGLSAIINIANVAAISLQVKEVLDFLIENDGDMPENIEVNSQEHYTIYNQEFKYSTRYFAVLYDEEGNLLSVKMDHIAAVDSDDAQQYAAKALDKGFFFGKIDSYFYESAQLEDGETIVVFLDASYQLSSVDKVLKASLYISVFGIIIIFFPVFFFSKGIIEPEIRNVKRQKQFITNASHELKTPLAVIRANTEVEAMVSGPNEWNESTMKQIERMSSLIENLVTIARFDENNGHIDFAQIDIVPVVEAVAKEFVTVADSKGKSLSYHVADELKMQANKDNITQLTTLLVDNAVKYCDDGGSIALMLAKERRMAVLDISNSYVKGEGQDYSKFFERFYREDKSHNIERGGYGIGLSIVEKIVSVYNGKIDVTFDGGMIHFTCKIPLKR